jgi:nucleoside-diphosphate-sugar epimerase
MEVLITGGNGLLGRHLVTALHDRGQKVRVLMLPGENGVWLQDRGVAVYEGDTRRPETLTEPIRGVGAILHLAGMSGVWEPVEAYRAVNLAGTINVCKEALAARVRKIVHISSWTVYGIGLGKSVREDFLLRPFDDPSSITKAAGDLAVQRMITDDDLPAVILRPGTFIGPGDHLHFGRIADRLLAREAVVIGSGDNALPFVYVDDVVRGVLLALDDQNAVGQAYNISCDQPLTQQQLLDAVAEDVGATSPSVHIPCNILYLAALAAERLALASGTKPALTRLGVQLFGTDNRHAIDKARRQLGYRPATPLRDAVRLTADWYLSQRAEGAQIGGGLAETPT